MKGYWDNLKPFEKRVVVGFFSAFFIVFNLWFVVPHYKDLGRIKFRMAKAQDVLRKFQGEVGQINFYSNQVHSLESEGLSVPPEEQSVQFLRAIQAQAAQSQVNITGNGRQTVRTNQFFLELAQSLSIQSGEQQLVDFLYNLGSGNSLIRVRDLTVHPELPARQQLSANVKLVASYQKKAAPKPLTLPAATPGKTGTPASPGRGTSGPPAKANAPMPRAIPQTNKPPTQMNKGAPGAKPTNSTSKRP